MKKELVIVMASAVAVWLLLRGPVTVGGFWQPDGGDDEEQGRVTAGDLESNIFSDSVSDVMAIFTNWPAGSAPYRQTIEAAAAAAGVPVEILAWLLWQESRYNPKIIRGEIRSPVGAMGIAQFMPATAREWLGSAEAALDPDVAIMGAARYLRWLFNQVGTWAEALAAYNWGIGNVKRKGLTAAPRETRDYYTTILARAGQGGGVFA
jgi:hypothetical protein